jgi:hypothetical protein
VSKGEGGVLRIRRPWLLAAAASLAASTARAEQKSIELGPVVKACPAVLLTDATPASWEWSYWAAGGAVRKHAASSGAGAGIGAELTAGLLTYPGFPSGDYGRRLGRAEVRAGFWASGSTRADGGLVEGGLKLHLGALYHASFGTFDWRFGVGSGAFVSGREPFGSVTLAYGVRSVPSRYSHRGYCDPRPLPRAFALTSVVRVFATFRRAFGSEESEWQFGVELSPSFFLPPYDPWRLLGGEPARD